MEIDLKALEQACCIAQPCPWDGPEGVPYSCIQKFHEVATPEVVEELIRRLRAAEADAARYRWLRQQHWSESDMAVVCHPKKSVKLGFDCPSGERLDAAIDAAAK